MLDKPVAHRVLENLEKLVVSECPQSLCKALTGNYSGLWRYRVGSYRVVIIPDSGLGLSVFVYN